MPNHENIKRPISLVGAGRSGTTLLTNVFRAHPQFESLGETGDLLFSTFHNVQSTLPICGPFFTPENAAAHTCNAVHSLLLSLASSERKYWFHKPIQIPKVRDRFNDEESFLKWWWNVHTSLFPDARTFTVLRNPVDIVVSSKRRWSFTTEQAVANLEMIYRWLLHDDSRCEFAVHFDQLVASPESTVQTLMDRIGIPYEPACLEVFKQVHSPNQGKEGLDTLQTIAERGYRHPDASQINIGTRLPALYTQLMDRFSLQSSINQSTRGHSASGLR